MHSHVKTKVCIHHCMPIHTHIETVSNNSNSVGLIKFVELLLLTIYSLEIDVLLLSLLYDAA